MSLQQQWRFALCDLNRVRSCPRKSHGSCRLESYWNSPFSSSLSSSMSMSSSSSGPYQYQILQRLLIQQYLPVSTRISSSSSRQRTRSMSSVAFASLNHRHRHFFLPYHLIRNVVRPSSQIVLSLPTLSLHQLSIRSFGLKYKKKYNKRRKMKKKKRGGGGGCGRHHNAEIWRNDLGQTDDLDIDADYRRVIRKRNHGKKNLHPAAKWKKILSSCDFWFSKGNLKEDIFLRKTIKKHHGYVPIQTLLTFPKFHYWTNAQLLIDAFTNSDRYQLKFDKQLWIPAATTTTAAAAADSDTASDTDSDTDLPQRSDFLPDDFIDLYDDDADEEYHSIEDEEDDDDDDGEESDQDDDTNIKNNEISKCCLDYRVHHLCMDAASRHDVIFPIDREPDSQHPIIRNHHHNTWNTKEILTSNDVNESNRITPNHPIGIHLDIYSKQMGRDDDTDDNNEDRTTTPGINESIAMDITTRDNVRYDDNNNNNNNCHVNGHGTTNDVHTRDIVTIHESDIETTNLETTADISDGNDKKDDGESPMQERRAHYHQEKHYELRLDSDHRDANAMVTSVNDDAIDEWRDLDFDDDDGEDHRTNKAIDDSEGDDDFDDDDDDDDDTKTESNMFEAEEQIDDDEKNDVLNAFVRHRRVTLEFIAMIEQEIYQESLDSDDDNDDDFEAQFLYKQIDCDKYEQLHAAYILRANKTSVKNKPKDDEVAIARSVNYKNYSTSRPVTLITTPEKLRSFCNALVQSAKSNLINHEHDPNAYAIGMDVEYCSLEMDIRNKLPAMIQLCGPDKVNGPVGLIWIHKFPNHGRDLLTDTHEYEPLIKIFSDPKLFKVGVSLSNDTVNLAQWCGITDKKDVPYFFSGIVNLEEIQDNDNVRNKSLQEMAAAVLQRNLPKIKGKRRSQKDRIRRVPTAHWRTNNITGLMKSYAANDVACSMDIWMRIQNLTKETKDVKPKKKKIVKYKQDGIDI